MSDVMDFVARVLEREGAVLERTEDRIEAVMPPELQGPLGVSEFCVLTEAGNDGEPCGYGSDALGKIARITLGRGRAAAFRLDLPDPPVQPPARFSGLNVSLRVLGAQARRSWTLVGLARYVANADDQREGLCRAAVGAPNGVSMAVPDLDTLPLTSVPAQDVPAEQLRRALPSLIAALRAQAFEDLKDFREAVARRRRRDEERLRKYFKSVGADLRRRIDRRHGLALQGKLDSLPGELQQKLAQLEADSVVRARIELVALAAIEGPSLVGELEVKRRKHTRVLEVHYDGLARRWSGLRCEGCGAATAAFALCEEARHVLCGRCWDLSGSGGRRPCLRCEGKPTRTPWSVAAPGHPAVKTGAPPGLPSSGPG